MKTIIAPSLFAANFTQLGQQLESIETHGADWVHYDVMDGRFVPNITMGPLILAQCKQAISLPFDVHLMIDDPECHIEAFIEAGATSITIHAEASPNLHRTLQTIKSAGCKAGVAINPGTSPEAVYPVLSDVDMVLVMTVNPGYSGQAFIPSVLPKITQIRQAITEQNLMVDIQVDGGISAKTLPLTKAAGANVFVAGSAVFNHSDGIAAAIQALKQAAL